MMRQWSSEGKAYRRSRKDAAWQWRGPVGGFNEVVGERLPGEGETSKAPEDSNQGASIGVGAFPWAVGSCWAMINRAAIAGMGGSWRGAAEGGNEVRGIKYGPERGNRTALDERDIEEGGAKDRTSKADRGKEKGERVESKKGYDPTKQIVYE
ncbi:hypothetical protein FA13DRAFT_1711886 [Coprinellus micaceus]|uniref:Uncharacterized protein n=1 Tax=Coprinellus micaceus TaxID=71717 RepID=A0A4Y7T2Y6_COPMI|nr:hypothetical protein FA13DRAFT_1711886 [Coprinellus micaceus]